MTTGKRPSFSILSDGEVEEIHQASLRILIETGVKIEDPKLRRDLSDLGCRIEAHRVRFDPDLIQKALESVKREVPLTSWAGRDLEVKPGNSLTHATGGMPFIIDLETGEKRRVKVADLAQSTRLMNTLDQLDMPTAMLYPHDVPPRISVLKQCEQLLRHTTKPVYGPGITSPLEAKYVVELFHAAAGSRATPSQNAVGVLGVSPESPLFYPREITDTIRVIIQAAIPTVMLIAPIAGLTAPMTMAGGLAQLNASMLVFAALAYLINDTTPVIYGARLASANMSTGSSIWGPPNTGIAGTCAVQMARYYGFPSDVYGLSCTSCGFDNQTGYEKAVNGLLPLLAGAHMISGFGSLASLMVGSYEQLAIDNETFSYFRQVLRGVSMNEDTLAMEVIGNVARGGNYLEQDHTLKHLRSGELFISKIGWDGSWSEWEARGSSDIRAAARDVARKVVDRRTESLVPPELDREIEKIMKAAHGELVEKA